MTRHAKNATARPVYSTHERKKDTAASGYGTKTTRLCKDSVKPFDACSLTMQRCQNPVVTLEGHLYDRPVILEYMIKQKRANAQRLAEYEKHLQKLKAENDVLNEESSKKEIKKFVSDQQSIVSRPLSSFEEDKKRTDVASAKSSADNSFWISSNVSHCANAGKFKPNIEKPSGKVLCPMSGKPLKLKDLVDVKFTLIDPKDPNPLSKAANIYKCPLSNDVLGNSVPCVVLKTSGNVITADAYTNLVKADMKDPFNNKPLTEKDVIFLERGASGFADPNIKLEAKKYAPSLMLS